MRKERSTPWRLYFSFLIKRERRIVLFSVVCCEELEKGELNLFFSFGIGKNTISAFSFYFTYSWAGVNKMGINLRVSFRKSIVRAGVV